MRRDYATYRDWVDSFPDDAVCLRCSHQRVFHPEQCSLCRQRREINSVVTYSDCGYFEPPGDPLDDDPREMFRIMKYTKGRFASFHDGARLAEWMFEAGVRAERVRIAAQQHADR